MVIHDRAASERALMAAYSASGQPGRSRLAAGVLDRQAPRPTTDNNLQQISNWTDPEADLGLRRSTSIALSSGEGQGERDRKSTRLNSSHLGISYAVFC